MTPADQPFWLRRMRVMLRRTSSVALILTNEGPVAKNGAAAQVGDGEILVGWYGRDVSDEQLIDDVASARVEYVANGRKPAHRAAA